MAEQQHPDPQLLERFLRCEAEGEERQIVVRHLLTGCPQCMAVTRRVWSLADGRGPGLLFEPRLRPRAAQERADAAEATLAQAWRRFAEQGLGREAAAAVLELALLYKRQDRWPDLCRLAGDEIRPVFYVRDLPNYAGAALLVFRRLVETEHVSERFLFEMARFLAGPQSHLRWAS